MKKIAIIGSALSGGAAQIIEALQENKEMTVECILDRDINAIGKDVFNVPVIGSTDDILKFFKEGRFNAASIAIGGDLIERERLFAFCNDNGVEMVNVIAKSVLFGMNVRLGKGNVILNNCYFGNNVNIGDNNYILNQCSVQHDTKISNTNYLATNVKIGAKVSIGSNNRIGIGAIIETPNFYPYKSGLDNLKIIAAIKNIRKFDFDNVMKIVNLEHRKTSKFKTYSLGMKQRLAIAATMIGDPEIVIFDEPTNGLDPSGIAEVREILMRIAESGRTVIMASHILDEVEKICSHVAIIKKGKLLADGVVGELLSTDYVLEINALDKNKLVAFINSNISMKLVNSNEKFISCTVKSDISPDQISTNAFNNGLILNHFVARKQSLEKEFLTITNE